MCFKDSIEELNIIRFEFQNLNPHYSDRTSSFQILYIEHLICLFFIFVPDICTPLLPGPHFTDMV